VRYPKPSDLLIAPPSLENTTFDSAVILLTHHDGDGSFGLCLNRPTTYTLEDLADEVLIDDLPPLPLYWGGPVSSGTVWMLHTRDWAMDSTVEIDDHWAMTSDKDMFGPIALGDLPEQFRLFVGYCAWAPNQLAAEVEGRRPRSSSHSWLIATNPGAEWCYEQPVDQLWEQSLELSGQEAVTNWL